MEGFAPPYSMPQFDTKTKIEEKVDYRNLPCPHPYEEIHREAYMALNPELFEGFRFDYTKSLNQKFALTHSILMGPIELPPEAFPTPPSTAVKIPSANYQFGALFADQKSTLVGNLTTEGKLHARFKYDLTDNLSIKGIGQTLNEEKILHGNIGFDYKGSDFRGQLQLGNGLYVTANYIQHVTPKLSLGSDIAWSREHLKSAVGFGARYETDKWVASGQLNPNVGVLNYVQKISEKISFAADFLYTFASRDVVTSVGYDYILRQCRIRGKVDSNGVVAAHLQEQLMVPGLSVLFSAEMDHVKEDYKFGFGLNLNV
ncbi:hypothetical protein AALP_AA4G055300 [Arabis alpina]|uniref:Uncharacterized protein n=1 Tax=Arabis alpina TaxID=50452 RepID=A0A087H1D0_ARAAL|nr:hypothetical protein AALP_AA4G055300 [Arabis alpina]